jgi:PKD repeat protein
MPGVATTASSFRKPAMFNVTRLPARLLAMTIAIGALSLSIGEAQAQRRMGEKLRPSFPSLILSMKQASGQAAIDQLSNRLPDVARWYGTSAEELKRKLLRDSRMRVDSTGRLLFVEDLATPVEAATAAQSDSLSGALASLDQTFLLHSRPGATRTIYLDFNGATISGTAWNSNGNTITAESFDLDGNPAAYSAAELQRIQYIWQRVAEDYAPFDVNVTTEQPAQDVLTRSGAGDTVFGTTVVITKTTGVYTCNCGGIAYIGVFNDAGGTRHPDYYKPAFVFYDKLGSGSEKPVAEAISHEAGHNMGLHHDGTSTSAYYAGHGAEGQTGWAPIMGVGYYKSLVQFSNGGYADANNREDDFAVAQSFGLPLRNDDHGSTTASARPLPAAMSNGFAQGSIDGVLEATGDRDVFAINSGAGPLTAVVAAASRSGNADLVISLLNAAGQVLTSANPANELGASLSYNLPAQGTYYLEVRGTGQGDAVTGYSDYGSLGNFRLSASHAAADGVAPSAVLSATVASGAAPVAVTFDGAQSTDDGRVAFWYWDFGDGTSDQTGASSSVAHVYRAAGSYVARLTVVDDSGLAATATQTITVTSAVAKSSVQNIQMTVKVNKKRGSSARAVVTVTNQSGQIIPGAVVQALWSGAVSKAAAARAAKTGRASFASPASKTPGCFTLTVTGISAAGLAFDAATLPSAEVCS